MHRPVDSVYEFLTEVAAFGKADVSGVVHVELYWDPPMSFWKFCNAVVASDYVVNLFRRSEIYIFGLHFERTCGCDESNS